MIDIYMFHYVTNYFNYYHFDKDDFENIIIKLKKTYKIISIEEYDQIISKKIDIHHQKLLLLTFDDGTIDHYNNVYRILKKHQCSGLFFITSSNFNQKILNIQIIHKLLSLNCFDEMYNYLLDFLNKKHIDFNKIIFDKNLDNERVAIFKQLLQNKLPEKFRNEILSNLTKKYNISTSSNDYYINIKNLKEMKENGMFFGIHTVSHKNLSILNYTQQYNEIYDNYKILKKHNLIDDKLLTISYPFGKYNQNTLKIVKKLKIKYGFRCSTSTNKSLFEIDRIDSNELKKLL